MLGKAKVCGKGGKEAKHSMLGDSGERKKGISEDKVRDF